MDDKIEKIEALVRDNINRSDIKNQLNPEILDDYFYPEIKRKKHHICYLKEYLNNDFLFKTIINDFLLKTIILDSEIRNEVLKEKKRNEPCTNCTLDCVNEIHPLFNFYSYLILMNINVRTNLVDKVEISKLIINCLNQFSLKGLILSYDFEMMLTIFRDYDLKFINKTLSKNSALNNLDYLNNLSDIVSTIDIQFSNISMEKMKSNSIHQLIKKKEKYYNKKLIIEEKLKNIETSQPEIPFNFQNNFDKVDKNKVYKYFSENLVKKGYLSKEDLEKYILLAFQNKKVPENKFKISESKVGNITNIFYMYYCDLASKPHGRKMDYAELLGLYFKGFEAEKVANNFARNYRKVRK
jgi:hypothetical protein